MGVWCRIMVCALMFMPRIYITTEQKCRFGRAMGLYSKNGTINFLPILNLKLGN